jgi:arsenite methyltransferase
MKDANTNRLLVMSDLGRPVMQAWQRQLRKVGWADRGSFMVFDARRMPLRSGCIPLVTSVGGLGDVSRNRLAYEEVARVLLPGGRLLDVVGFWEEGGSTQKGLSGWEHATSTWADYVSLLCELGLSIERSELYSTGKSAPNNGLAVEEETWECRLVFATKITPEPHS